MAKYRKKPVDARDKLIELLGETVSEIRASWGDNAKLQAELKEAKLLLTAVYEWCNSENWLGAIPRGIGNFDNFQQRVERSGFLLAAGSQDKEKDG